MDKNLIILVTAFNPSSTHVTSVGSMRLKQYCDGFQRIVDLAQKFPGFDYVVVDNTITSDWAVPEELKNIINKIPNLKWVYSIDSSGVSKKNKGCGVLLNLKAVFKQINTSVYKYCIYFEPRQLLLDFSFFERFVSKPANYFSTIKYRVTAKTKSKFIQNILKIVPIYKKQYNVGLFSIETPELLSYLNLVDLEQMAEKAISMEDDMYKKLSASTITKVKILGILWHNAYENVYVPY